MPRPRKRNRRAHGEGAIYRRKDKAGKVVGYRGELYLGVDAQGKAIKWRCSAKTEAEVVNLLTRARSDLLGGTLVAGPAQTVGEYLDWWLADAAKPHLGPRTFDDYESIVRLHLKPILGSLPLRKLTAQHLLRVYALKREEGLSPRRVQLIHAVAHKALHDAVRLRLLPYNIADQFDRPEVAKKEMASYTADQARQLLVAARDDPYEALYVLALTTGLRQGELLGLKWSDLDVGTVRVQRELARLRGQGLVLKEQKNEGSRRLLILTPLAIDALTRHRDRQRSEQGLIFTNRHGGPVDPSKLLLRYYYPLLRRAGLPKVRFHDLRHTTATLLLGLGINPKIVQEIMGHSQIGVTMDTYSHVLPVMHANAMGQLNELLSVSPQLPRRLTGSLRPGP